jgi:hypothetical protein
MRFAQLLRGIFMRFAQLLRGRSDPVRDDGCEQSQLGRHHLRGQGARCLRRIAIAVGRRRECSAIV